MVGFVGPNGSGKTTLLNIISGFVESDSGTVRLGDVDITGTPTHKVAALGLARTFQVPRLVDDLTVGENVELGEIGLDRHPALAGLCSPPALRRNARTRHSVAAAKSESGRV